MDTEGGSLLLVSADFGFSQQANNNGHSTHA
jgi:hypothetical protein